MEEEDQDENKLEIGFDEIANIVSRWAKVPVSKLTESESQKYLFLADNLKKLSSDKTRPLILFLMQLKERVSDLKILTSLSDRLYLSDQLVSEKHIWRKNLPRNCSTMKTR